MRSRLPSLGGSPTGRRDARAPLGSQPVMSPISSTRSRAGRVHPHTTVDPVRRAVRRSTPRRRARGRQTQRDRRPVTLGRQPQRDALHNAPEPSRAWDQPAGGLTRPRPPTYGVAHHAAANGRRGHRRHLALPRVPRVPRRASNSNRPTPLWPMSETSRIADRLAHAKHSFVAENHCRHRRRARQYRAERQALFTTSRP